jgi:hypothetical protein
MALVALLFMWAILHLLFGWPIALTLGGTAVWGVVMVLTNDWKIRRAASNGGEYAVTDKRVVLDMGGNFKSLPLDDKLTYRFDRSKRMRPVCFSRPGRAVLRFLFLTEADMECLASVLESTEAVAEDAS